MNFSQGDASKVLGDSWGPLLWQEFNKQYMRDIIMYIQTCRKKGIPITPGKGKVYEAYKETPYNDIKVVIVGQDPYPVPGMASGLAFGIAENCLQVPGTLKNINKELESDLGFQGFLNLSLKTWANQGVFLLNSCLTTVSKQIGAHTNIGWQVFTGRTLEEIAKKEHVVWILWGNYAKNVALEYVNPMKHGVIQSVHPSPKNTAKFLGSKPFSRCNEFLEGFGMKPIDWWTSEKRLKVHTL